jgi:hypothetical protein
MRSTKISIDDRDSFSQSSEPVMAINAKYLLTNFKCHSSVLSAAQTGAAKSTKHFNDNTSQFTALSGY